MHAPHPGHLTRVAAAMGLALLTPLAGAVNATTASANPAANVSAQAPVAAAGSSVARKPAASIQAPSAAATAAAAARVESMTTGPCSQVEIAPVVQIQVGKSTVLRPRTPLNKILLGNPDAGRAGVPSGPTEVAGGTGAAPSSTPATTAPRVTAANPQRPGVAEIDVVLLGPTEVYLLGKTIGTTNVVMVDRNGQCTAFDVVVGMDVSALQTVIKQLLPEEKDIKVSAAFDSIVLTGSLSDPEALIRITDLANAYVRGQGDGGASKNPRIINMLSVGAPQQVMLEVKVAEVSKNLLDQFGIDFSRAFALGDGSAIKFLSGIIGGTAGTLGQIAATGANGVPLSSVGAVVGGTIQGVTGASAGNVTATFDANGVPTYTTSYGTVPGQGVTNVNLKMQKTDGLVKVLAEPSVMAISGQTGSFLAGGKIFIPVAQSGTGGAATVTLEEKEFGVSVKFTPTVLGNGRINLRVRPEVSELNSGGVTISGVGGTSVLPSFTSRKAETTVQLMDGQSFAIGGLIKNNTTTNIKAFPFLGELPIVGALFRSTEFQTDKSELVFVITPRLVKPLPADFVLPTDGFVPPTRQELILEGKLEGKREAPAKPTTPAAAAASGGFDAATPLQPAKDGK